MQGQAGVCTPPTFLTASELDGLASSSSVIQSRMLPSRNHAVCGVVHKSSSSGPIDCYPPKSCTQETCSESSVSSMVASIGSSAEKRFCWR